MVEIFKVRLDEIDLSIIRRAADVILSGGLVVYPTDTVYGLGADPFNLKAVGRVFRVKGRGRKPMPILVSSVEIAGDLVYVDDMTLSLMEAFWPGPLTIVLRKKPVVPDAVTAGFNTLGVRMPNHPVALKLIELCGGRIIGTSANLSGCPPPRTAYEAINQIGDKVDLVIDSGACPIGISSTVISLVDGVKIIREGSIKAEVIMNFIKRREFKL